MVPNTFYPKASRNTLRPSDLMIGLETYWACKHAWRGAGYYYRKGDHVPPTKGGISSLTNALSLVAAWETWYLPRPQPVDPVLVTDPSAWELDAHYPDNFEQPSCPAVKPIPISMGKREGTLIGFLSPSKGNLWKLLYETMNSTIKLYWKYAHHYAVQHSLANAEYYSWEKFTEELTTVNLDDVTWSPPTEFDPRFSYYSKETDLTTPLSSEELRVTSEENEVAKTSRCSMNELPSLELRIIPEESELGARGRKKGAEEDISAPPQKGKKGSARGSSVPPGSDTARAREQAEAKKLQEQKGKGSNNRALKDQVNNQQQ